MGVLLHDDRFVTSLKNMPLAMMATVEALGVDAIQVTHAPRQIGLRRFDQQVIMIRHQTIGVTAPTKALNCVAQQREKQFTVVVLQEDIFASISSRGDMVHSTRYFYS